MENVGLQHIRAFPFTELEHITNKFSEERVIGRGGSGVVYKVWLLSISSVTLNTYLYEPTCHANKLFN